MGKQKNKIETYNVCRTGAECDVHVGRWLPGEKHSGFFAHFPNGASVTAATAKEMIAKLKAVKDWKIPGSVFTKLQSEA